MFLFILLQFMPDGAPFYAETQASAWIKEPWNAVSSLTFWLPVFYWAGKLRGKYHQHWFLSACLPLLFLGGLGSALFHGFRVSRFLLWLDVLPTLVIFVGLTLYFWQKILPNVWALVGLVGTILVLQGLVMTIFEPAVAVNYSYIIRGTALFLPAALLLKRIAYKGTLLLFLAIGFFILAIVFRSVDKAPFMLQIFSMGSHWLWHLSTVVGAFYLAEFLYRLPSWEAKVS